MFAAGSLCCCWLGAMPAGLPAVVAKATDERTRLLAATHKPGQRNGCLPRRRSAGQVQKDDDPGRSRSLAARTWTADVVREFPVLSRLRQRSYVPDHFRSAQHRSSCWTACAPARTWKRCRPITAAACSACRTTPAGACSGVCAKSAPPTAWENNTGSAGVVLAVLDTGVDYRHEDLAANMWTNPGEIAANGSRRRRQRLRRRCPRL